MADSQNTFLSNVSENIWGWSGIYYDFFKKFIAVYSFEPDIWNFSWENIFIKMSSNISNRKRMKIYKFNKFKKRHVYLCV